MRRTAGVLFPTFVVLLGCASWTTRLPGQGNDWQLAKTVAQLETPFAVGPGVQALGEWQRANATGGSEVQRATVMLALLAAGSTMRSGPQKDAIKRLVVAIRAVDAWPTPIAVGDHVLTALAMERCFFLSNSQVSKSDGKRGREGLRAHVEDSTTAPIRPEDLVLRRLLAGEAKACGLGDAAGESALAAALDGARTTFRLGQSRRSDGANLLLERLAGKKVEDERLIATCWPANPAADPLHTWLAVQAAGLVAAPLRERTLAQLAPLVEARLAAGHEQAGTWEPAAGFDRITTTAVFTLALATANTALVGTEPR